MKKYLVPLTALIGLVLIPSCKKDHFPEPGSPDTTLIVEYIDDSLREEFNTAINALGGCTMSAGPIGTPQPTGSATETTEIQGDQNWTCTNQPMIYGPEFSEVAVFSPDETVWVGSIMRGDAVSSGSWTPVVYEDRNAYPVTVSLASQTGSSSTEAVDQPSYSNYIAAHNTLIQNIATGSTPANMSFHHYEVNAREEVQGHVGASFGGWGVDISGSYNWSSMERTSKVLTKFVQSYYTVGLDIPAQPDQWFGTLPSYEQMASYCPVYISNITYGRVIYLTIETSSTQEELDAAVDASFSGFGINGSIDWSRDEMQSLEERSVQAFIRGGGASTGAELIASGNVNEAIAQGANFSASNPGVPIGFTVRRLSDNAIVDFVTIQEYAIQNCELTGTLASAEIQDGPWRSFCPILELGGDGEFDGHGPRVSGTITLSHDDTNVFANMDIEFDETTAGSAPGHTRAMITDQMTLYTAPFGQRISSIEANQTFYVDYIEGPDGSHDPENLAVTCDFIERVIINGDTGGDDLPCDQSDDNSYMKVKFRPFNITLVDN
jgi:thiol-activated cytolysin